MSEHATTAPSRQLAFDLGQRPALDMEDFLVAGSNRDAVAWLDRWPDWPGPAIALVGPTGSGKTHLAHVFARRCGGKIVGVEDILASVPPVLADNADALAIEDADRGVDEAAMLHHFNWAAETGRHLLITCRLPPARWSISLADLKSRLAAMPVARLRAPDDELLAAVLVKTLGDRQLLAGQDVVRFVVPRIERSFAALHQFVAGIDARALAEHRNITVPLARIVLREMEQREES